MPPMPSHLMGYGVGFTRQDFEELMAGIGNSTKRTRVVDTARDLECDEDGSNRLAGSTSPLGRAHGPH